MNMMNDSLDEALILRRPVTVLRDWLVQIYPHYVRGRTFSAVPYQLRESYLHGIDYCHFESSNQAYREHYVG